MKQMIPVVETKNYAVCPCCEKQTSSIDHLLNTDISTSWYCDSCGERYRIIFKKSGEVFTQAIGERVNKNIVLLKNGNVGLVVEGMSFSDAESNHEYYYNEHTCPTNYMKNVLAVIDLEHNDSDPHGIFEYVATLDWDKNVEDCNYDYSDIVTVFEEKQNDN